MRVRLTIKIGFRGAILDQLSLKLTRPQFTISSLTVRIKLVSRIGVSGTSTAGTDNNRVRRRKQPRPTHTRARRTNDLRFLLPL